MTAEFCRRDIPRWNSQTVIHRAGAHVGGLRTAIVLVQAAAIRQVSEANGASAAKSQNACPKEQPEEDGIATDVNRRRSQHVLLAPGDPSRQ